MVPDEEIVQDPGWELVKKPKAGGEATENVPSESCLKLHWSQGSCLPLDVSNRGGNFAIEVTAPRQDMLKEPLHLTESILYITRSIDP